MDQVARLIAAGHALLRSFATGDLGRAPVIAVKDILASPEIGELSQALDACDPVREGDAGQA